MAPPSGPHGLCVTPPHRAPAWRQKGPRRRTQLALVTQMSQRRSLQIGPGWFVSRCRPRPASSKAGVHTGSCKSTDSSILVLGSCFVSHRTSQTAVTPGKTGPCRYKPQCCCPWELSDVETSRVLLGNFPHTKPSPRLPSPSPHDTALGVSQGVRDIGTCVPVTMVSTCSCGGRAGS